MGRQDEKRLEPGARRPAQWGLLTILRVRGASCRDIDKRSEGTLHRLCLYLFLVLVDLHFPRGQRALIMSWRLQPYALPCHLFSSFSCSPCVLLRTARRMRAKPSPTTGAKPTPTPTVALDVYGTPIVFPTTAPQRIVSLVPSTSEILGALHLQSRVVGIDYYTDYPPDLTSRPRVSNADGKYNVEQIVA